MKNYKVYLMASAAAIAITPSTVQAQDDDKFALEEIVVTAQKREQSMQDVGIAVTAMTGNMMQERGIDNVVKIQDTTPNLRIKQSFGAGIPQYSIRGIGENADTSAFSSSPVAVHINEVPNPYPVTTTGLLFDLARVEVLRGPQGDLFGLNTTGGTINYITNKPTDEFDGGLLLEYGSYDRYKVEGFVSGPISDGLNGRIAVTQNSRTKGWQDNQRTGETLGEFDKTGVRAALEYKTDNLTADLEVHYSRTQAEPTGSRNIVEFTTFQEYLLYLPITGTIQDGFYDTDWSEEHSILADGTKPYVDHEGWGGSLVINYDMDDMTLTSVTGYDRFKREEYLDQDGDQWRDSDQFFKSDLWTFSQELRLSGQAEDLSWVVGGNYAQDSMDNLSIFDIVDNFAFPAAAGQDMTQKRKVWALFGNVEYEVNDRLSLVGGFRYTDEKRDAHNIGTNLYFDEMIGFGTAVPWFDGTIYEGATLLDLFGLGGYGLEPYMQNGFLQDMSGLMDMFYGPGDIFVPSNTIEMGGSPLTDADFTCFAFVGPCFEGRNYDDSIPSSDWSGKIGFNYDMSDEVMVYGTISRGFKSGGFLETAASSSLSFTPVAPETVVAYELGAKGDLDDGRARLNVSAFYYDYKNQQVNDNIVDPIFGPLGVLKNVPKTEIYGFEAELTWALSESLEIGQNFGYTKATFKEFSNSIDGGAVRSVFSECLLSGAPDCVYVDVFQDLSGESMVMPEIQYSGYLNFETPLSEAWTFRAVLDWSYESEVSTNSTWYDRDGGIHDFTLPSYWLVNARVSVASDENWEVTVFGDNILDAKYLTSYQQWNEAVVKTPGMPATYGVRVKLDF